MNDRKSHPHDPSPTDLTWRKSSASAGEHDCVEIAELPAGGLAVRDSKDRSRRPIHFGAAGWAAFQAGLLADEFSSGRHFPTC